LNFNSLLLGSLPHAEPHLLYFQRMIFALLSNLKLELLNCNLGLSQFFNFFVAFLLCLIDLFLQLGYTLL
jgi:hypothetical protein